MLDMLMILGSLCLGMAVGFTRRADRALLHIADRTALFAVYLMLFLLGARLGADAVLLSRLPELGGRAFWLSSFCTAGSVLFLTAAGHFFPLIAAPLSPGPGNAASALKASLTILFFFLFGIVLANASFVPMALIRSNLVSYALYLLVFTVGIGLGANIGALRILRDMSVGILTVPLLALAGTVAGAVSAALVLPDSGLPGGNLKDALCVGLGLGYYSLSSILIENAGDSALASVALMANVLREVATLLAAPLIARYFGGLALVGAAGGTAMDTTLPVIARCSGERCAIVAVFSGMVLTLLVPFLVSAALLL